MIFYFYVYLNIIYKNIAFFVVKFTLDLNIKVRKNLKILNKNIK